jgi:hypothetical protein
MPRPPWLCANDESKWFGFYELTLTSGNRISTAFNGQSYFSKTAESKVLDEYYNSALPRKVSPIPALKYTTDPLKSPTTALLVLTLIPAKITQDP